MAWGEVDKAHWAMEIRSFLFQGTDERGPEVEDDRGRRREEGQRMIDFPNLFTCGPMTWAKGDESGPESEAEDVYAC